MICTRLNLLWFPLPKTHRGWIVLKLQRLMLKSSSEHRLIRLGWNYVAKLNSLKWRWFQQHCIGPQFSGSNCIITATTNTMLHSVLRFRIFISFSIEVPGGRPVSILGIKYETCYNQTAISSVKCVSTNARIAILSLSSMVTNDHRVSAINETDWFLCCGRPLPKSFLAWIFSEIVIWNVSEGIYWTAAGQMVGYLCYRQMQIGSVNFFLSKWLWTCHKSVWTEGARWKVRQTFSYPTFDLKAFCDIIRK